MNYPIKGKYPLKKKTQPIPSLEEFAGSVGNVGKLAQELKELKEEVIEVVDYKIEEVENTLQGHIKTIVDTTKVLEDTKSEAIAIINEVKVGPPGKDADEKRVADMVRSQFPDAKKLEKDILAKVPKFDEKKLKRDILENIPKASLKVIQSKLEVDPLSVVEKIMALPKGKFKLKADNIEGLEQTLSAFQSQLGRGYLHGGGDTVTAGTNITLVRTPDGKTQINATNGTTLELETNGTPNGDQTLLNLVQGSNVTITDDGSGNVTIAATGDTGVSGVTGTSPIVVDNTDPANPIVTIQQANTSQSGFLSDTDWDTFNNKQGTISLTTSGTSGAATFIGNTLNIPQYQAAGTYVTSVTGTANRITSSGGTTPQIDIAASYVGQSSITTLGTIGTGVWQGTAIGDSYITNTLTGKSVNGVTLVSGGSATKYLSEDGTYTTPAGGSSGITIGTTTITSGTNTRILYNNSGVVGEYTLTGSGTVVAMQTSPTFNTSINGAYLTASEILITDGSKNIVSAPVATYPSLTELTYVKGVTSAIQTQLNGKAATLSGTNNEIAYFNSASTISSLATATYPSLTELSYVKGVTSSIQTQLNGKQATLTPAALTKTDDTNVTLTLGGTPATALLQATSLTLGWTGTLSLARGGTGANLSDPGVNAVYVWDDTTNATRLATLSGLTYDSGTNTLTSSGSATPGGADTEVQFNDGGAFGGDSSFVFNKTNNTLIVGDSSLTNSSLLKGLWGFAEQTVTAISGSERVILEDADGSFGDFGLRVAGGGYGALNFAGSRGTLGSPTIVSNLDTVGEVSFYGYDGTNYEKGAYIRAYVDGTPGSNDMPTALVFATTPDGSNTAIQRMRIDSVGNTIPGGSNIYSLGNTSAQWADLFLGTGAVINFNNSDVTLTHSSDALTVGGGEFVLAAGTTTIAPLKFTSGTNLTTSEAGGFEYDGKVFYSSPIASGRGVSPSVQFAIVQSDFTLANATGVQSAFPTTCDVFTLAASTTYFFEGQYSLTTGSTSTILNIAFAAGGGLTVTAINYQSFGGNSAAINTQGTSVFNQINTLASTTVLATSGNASKRACFKGVIQVNAGGTLTPQIDFNSSAPGGTNLMKAGSWIRFYPVGTNTVEKVGNIA